MELRPAGLLKEWSEGKFRPVYLLLGEDSAGKAEALSKLKALFKADPMMQADTSGRKLLDALLETDPKIGMLQ